MLLHVKAFSVVIRIFSNSEKYVSVLKKSDMYFSLFTLMFSRFEIDKIFNLILVELLKHFIY